MDLKLVLEAILFSAQQPLSPKELKEVLAGALEHSEAPEVRTLKRASVEAIGTALEELAQDHARAERSFRLVCVAGAWQFVSQPEYAPWIKALVGRRARPPRLSQPALETLAIIAYRQPITRAEIEQVRGVAVDGVMQTLQERGLVEPVGRAETPGRPITYGTTPAFLEYFGLRSLEDLPAADELRRAPVPRPQSLPTAEPGLATVPPAQLTLAAAAHPEPGPGTAPAPESAAATDSAAATATAPGAEPGPPGPVPPPGPAADAGPPADEPPAKPA